MGFFALYCTIYLAGLIERKISPCLSFFFLHVLLSCALLLVRSLLVLDYISKVEIEIKN